MLFVCQYAADVTIIKMQIAKWVLSLLSCAGALAGADPKWIHIRNENFQIYSSAKEGETRTAFNHFERVRNFFVQMTGAPPANPVPVFVIVFGSEKEYEPFRLNEFATAYYSGQADRDYIVIGKAGEQSAQIVTHEYAHLVIKHMGFALPPWLNEGLAELFSTVKPLGKDTEFGDIIPGRLRELAQSKWIPLTTLLTVDRNSPYYNETKRAGAFYAESWALVHMLETTDEYRGKFWNMVAAVQAGTPSAAALEQTYGMPLAKLEQELNGYVRGNSFRKLVTKIKLEDIDKLPAQSADIFAVRTLHADLMAGRGKNADARSRYEELRKENSQRPEPWSGLGYIAWREGNQEEAVTNFAQAYELGARGQKFLLDFGRLAQRSRPTDAAAAFTELLKLDPKNSDARLELAALQLNQRQYAQALTTVQGITSVKTAEQRDRTLYIRAAAALQAGDRAEARKIAQELKRATSAAEYVSRVDDMLRYLDQSERAATLAVQAPTIVPSSPVTESESPVEATPVTRRDMEMILQDARGSLVEINCSNPASFVLETDRGRKTFLILQPDRLIVTGRKSGKAQFACGAQNPPIPVRLQFTIAPEDSDAAGVVRIVHFDK